MANPNVTRDQRWAIYAYEEVARVRKESWREYRTVVNDLSANILRNGLSSAIAALERRKSSETSISALLLTHLSKAEISGLGAVSATELPARVRQLDVDDYIFATRETLRLSAWLKRASQATFGDT